MSVAHYENFPVASILCPPRIRAAVVAIYHFARTADDIADEGDAPADTRLAELLAYRDELRQAYGEGAPSARWAVVFVPLQRAIREHALPLTLLEQLLDAFMQDLGNPVYADRTELLDYCDRSANPVGRLLLHLYDRRDGQDLAHADAICSALQLINFWQDLSVDLPRGRSYVPRTDAERHGLRLDALRAGADTAASRALVRDLVGWARDLMREGQVLALDLPGRAGWELRLVVQGGLRILEKIDAMDHAALSNRPTLGWRDAPILGWRALTMTRR